MADDMCSQLENALKDEKSAQGEYSSLRIAASSEGHEMFAETVRQISKQEQTHESIFSKAHDMYCE